MTKCSRCWLHDSIRIVNLIINLLGVAMIIYCLWLQKKWMEGVAELPQSTSIPKLWFINASLGVGITVCLSAICGHMVANCISNYALCAYIFAICSSLLLEVAVIVAIFFKIDWRKEIPKYIDEHHYEFRSFVIFHLEMCRFTVIFMLLPQIYVTVLASILCAIGIEPFDQHVASAIPDFTHSFLVPNSSALHVSAQTCRGCEILRGRTHRRRSFISVVESWLTMILQRRNTV
ncbi:tetraspanin-19-like isoform X1 [Tripterygium wilfordii]|uniref:Tetraspanin-19-like isoform X1 n=1 Tax=Tripterygium wilfordii TaxID=458696 RepID=A0A7J7DPP1_TRIWF|nr:tetraspanin-19-like [Tripterygium wilfordii]KAF5748249.1 tetraspanin-19-like isoform X1 [Tripterygium wilfordii]